MTRHARVNQIPVGDSSTYTIILYEQVKHRPLDFKHRVIGHSERHLPLLELHHVYLPLFAPTHPDSPRNLLVLILTL